MKLTKRILVVLLIVFSQVSVKAQTSYTLVTSNVDLIAGEKYIVASGASGQIKAMGYQNNNNRPAATTSYTVTSSTIVLTSAITTGTLTDVYEFTLGGSIGNWTLFDPIYNGYLNAAGAGGSSNYLRTVGTNDAKGIWTINIDNSTSVATITSNGGVTRNWMRFNSTNNPPLFACYTSGQADIYLYKAGVSTPMAEINVKQNTSNVLNNGTYNFGTHPDGSSLSSVFTIENIGAADLEITSFTFTGSSDFTVNAPFPLTISASSSSTFSVSFNPSSVGTLTASVALVNNDSDENPYTINFVGNSIAAIPEINIAKNGSSFASNSTYNFSPILMNTTSVATFAIQNIGGATLNITSSTFTGSSELVITSDYTIPFSIPYGDFATFTVTFSPIAASTYSAATSFDNNDGDENPYTLNFTGEGVAPYSEINVKQAGSSYVSSSNFDFGTKVVSSNTDIVFTIENLGNSNLTISTYTLSGSEFTLQGTMPTTISAGATANFTVRFVPTSATTFSGNIVLANNDGDENPYTINFTGEGIAPYSEINVKQAGSSYASSSNFDFGTKVVSSNTDIVFTIENLGNSNLTISTYTLSGSEFTLQGTMPTTISAGATANFTVRFVPTSSTTFSGNIVLTNNDADENPYTINFSGAGIVAPPEINVKESGINYFNNSTYDFANRTVGTTTDVIFTLENIDSGTLLISTYSLSGSAFTLQTSIPASLNGNSTTIFTIRFNAASAGAHTGVLTIVNNDGNEPNYIINLTGSGVALPSAPNLKVNEIMGNPTSGSDWFEIYNPGASAVNLSGLYVSNSSLVKYKFPAGSPSVSAGGFVIVYANGQTATSPLEANFTISNTDEVFLYSYDGVTVVDQLAITDAVAGQSQGRVSDGGSELMSFSTATPGATNSAGVGVVSVEELTNATKLILAPNPTSSVFTISYTNLNNEKTFSYRVLDVVGKEVLSSKTNAVSGLNVYAVDVTSIAKGLYFVECVVGDKKVTSKIVVE